MSQQSYTLPDGRFVLWGKDHMLGWFLDVHKSADCDIESVLTEESTLFTKLTGSEMHRKLIELGVPESEL